MQESTLAGTRSVVLDNGVFRLAVLPEFGGRLCSLFYRPAQVELLATEILQRDSHRATGVRGGWCAAFPALLANGEALARQAWEYELLETTDTHAAIRLTCRVERVLHRLGEAHRVTPVTIGVERIIRMTAGQPHLCVEDVLTNRSSWPVPTTWAGMISLRAGAGDRVVIPVPAIEVQNGLGPTGNELDFGLLVTTPYQALARNLQAGWLGFRPATVPIDVRLSFPHDYLPHAAIIGLRDDKHAAGNAFRLQPLATPGPIADDSRGGALVLPPNSPISLPITLEVGPDLITAGAWSRPGLQLAQLITAYSVSPARLALWRVGTRSFVFKTRHYLGLLMPEFDEECLLLPEDLPSADVILCGTSPRPTVLAQLAARTRARFIGPPLIRQHLLEAGFGDDRAILLSPGARVDLTGLGVLATPARTPHTADALGFLLHFDHLSLYHAGDTQFLGEFGAIGQQFQPQLVLLPVSEELSVADAVHAAKILQPRLVVPLGADALERDFAQRCREHHLNLATRLLHPAEGTLFDGWRLHPLA